MCKICGLEHRVGADGLSRRRFMLSTGAVATASIWASAGRAKDTGPVPKPQNVVSPDQALDLLQKGNRRYVEGVSRRHDFQHEREALTAGQNPYAGILSCADSRVAPEYAFDSGRGDLSSAVLPVISRTMTRSPVSNMPWRISAYRSFWCLGTMRAARLIRLSNPSKTM